MGESPTSRILESSLDWSSILHLLLSQIHRCICRKDASVRAADQLRASLQSASGIMTATTCHSLCIHPGNDLAHFQNFKKKLTWSPIICETYQLFNYIMVGV